MGRTSFARFMSVFSPMYACMGSRIISRAPFCVIAFSMRSSDRVFASVISILETPVPCRISCFSVCLPRWGVSLALR